MLGEVCNSDPLVHAFLNGMNEWAGLQIPPSIEQNF
jgi:hypothetical protein